MIGGMRQLPWLMGLLVVVVGGYLGFQVLGRQDAPAAAAPPVATASTVPQGHVYAGISDTPESINPFTTSGSAARRYVLGFTHETLIDSDPDTLELRPVLAQSFHEAAGGTEITMVLRPGVRFSDGKPCTPRDVMFTWEVCKAQPALLGSMADGMSLLRDVQLLPGEPPTLHLVLKQPHFAGLRAIGESWIVVERAFFEGRIAELAKAAGQAVPESPSDPAFGTWLAAIRDDSGPGTGPYMLAPDSEGQSRWHRGSDLRLVRNPLSWRKAMYPDRWNFAGVHLVFPSDPTQPWLQFLAREFDWFPDSDLTKATADDPALAEDFRRVVYDNPLYGPVLMHWNLRRLPDPKVRRALGMLFDRDTIASGYYRGAAVPAATFFRPGDGCCPPDLQPLPFDMATARQMLRDAGHDAEGGHPLKLHLILPSGPGTEALRQICSTFADDAKKSGIEVEVQALELAAIAQLRQAGDWDGYLLRRDFRTYVDPFEDFHSDGGSNVMGLRDTQADDLLVRARGELDERRRQALFQAWCRRIDELQPVSFLVFQRSALLINSHLQNAVPGKLGLAAEKMWVPKQFQRQ